MSNTTYWYFEGPCSWAKVYKSQLDPKYKRWSIDVYLDEKNMVDFKRSGLQLTVRDDENGRFVRFSRPAMKLIKNTPVEFEPPEVIKLVGADENVPFDQPIGNGSRVRVKVAVYNTFKGLGHRLEKIQVIEHVPYSATNVGNIPEGEKVPF